MVMRRSAANRKQAFLVVAGVLIFIATALQLNFRLGFNFGPYRVGPGDSLYGILINVFDGSEFHAAEVINNWNVNLDPDLVYANKNMQVRDGDVVTARYNTLIIERPNGAKYTTDLVDQASLMKRNVQLLFRNLLIVVLAIMSFVLIYLGMENIKDKKFYKRVVTSILFGCVALVLFEVGLYIARLFMEGYL